MHVQVRPFIRTEETRSKILFLSGQARVEALQQSIPPQVLCLARWIAIRFMMRKAGH